MEPRVPADHFRLLDRVIPKKEYMKDPVRPSRGLVIPYRNHARVMVGSGPVCKV